MLGIQFNLPQIRPKNKKKRMQEKKKDWKEKKKNFVFPSLIKDLFKYITRIFSRATNNQINNETFNISVPKAFE